MMVRSALRPRAAYRSIARALVLVLGMSLATIGCGGHGPDPAADAGIVIPDAQESDARPLPDASVPPVPPANLSQLTGATGRVSGGVYKAEVQLGHWHGAGGFSGGNYNGQGAAAIQP